MTFQTRNQQQQHSTVSGEHREKRYLRMADRTSTTSLQRNRHPAKSYRKSRYLPKKRSIPPLSLKFHPIAPKSCASSSSPSSSSSCSVVTVPKSPPSSPLTPLGGFTPEIDQNESSSPPVPLLNIHDEHEVNQGSYTRCTQEQPITFSPSQRFQPRHSLPSFPAQGNNSSPLDALIAALVAVPPEFTGRFMPILTDMRNHRGSDTSDLTRKRNELWQQTYCSLTQGPRDRAEEPTQESPDCELAKPGTMGSVLDWLKVFSLKKDNAQQEIGLEMLCTNFSCVPAVKQPYCVCPTRGLIEQMTMQHGLFPPKRCCYCRQVHPISAWDIHPTPLLFVDQRDSTSSLPYKEIYLTGLYYRLCSLILFRQDSQRYVSCVLHGGEWWLCDPAKSSSWEPLSGMPSENIHYAVYCRYHA